MMKRFFCILLGIAGMVFVATSEASICDPANTVVYFGNGIDTSILEAYHGIDVIDNRLKANLTSTEFELLEFDVSYNETGGIILDLLEASIQDLQTDYSRFWRILGGIEIMPDWFADIMNELAASVDRIALVTTDSLAVQVNDYQRKIDEGKKILLVAHSQGNFFGNQAYGVLSSSDKLSFGIVSVANPDNIVANGGPYSTLEEDKVIMYVELVKNLLGLPLPKPPNLTNSPIELADERGHSFIGAYMIEGSNSDQKITSDIIAAIAGLTKPRQTVKPGVITVTLTWGSEPDMDLHVYEPNGYHVYWYDPDGYSGSLDRDDRTGWGPEHYYVTS
jgi:hypothetical protein